MEKQSLGGDVLKPHEDDERNQLPNRTNSRPNGIHTHSDSEQATRTQLKDSVEAAKRNLEIELAALRRAEPANMNLSALERGEGKLRQLDALLDRLAGASPGAMLAALGAEVSAAVATSSGVAAQTGSTASSAVGYMTSISQAEYQRATAEWDRKIAQSYAAEATHLAYAHDIAKRYGIDISGFNQERKELESERDEARKKGDKLGERMADALVAHNTFNTLATELEHISDPEARRRHLDEMRAQQKIVDERTAAVSAQAELDGRRHATQQNMSPEQAKTYIDGFKKQKLQEFDDLAKQLKGADTGEAVRRIILPKDASLNQRSGNAPSSIAELGPHVQSEIQRAASAIRRTEEATDAEMALSPKSEPSQIRPASSPEQHQKVEAPKTPKVTEAGTSKVLG
jgi:hypothetical protein